MNASGLVVVATLIAPGVAPADETFRCGQYLVTSALTISELTHRCGEPTSREKVVEDVRARNHDLMVVVGQTVTEKWTFDRGTRAAPMLVTIVDGKIKSIERKK